MSKDKLLQSLSVGRARMSMFVVFGIILFASLFAASYGTVDEGKIPTDGPQLIPVTLTPAPEQNNLQLYTLKFKTVSPTPSPSAPPVAVPVFPTTPPTSTGQGCPMDSVKPNNSCACVFGESTIVYCKDDQATCSSLGGKYGVPPIGMTDTNYCMYIMVASGYAEKLKDPNCLQACVAKPVIYLYPTHTTLVDVSLTIPGTIYKSDPLYPKNGWKDVTAHPDGRLVYQGKNYHELYYESSVDHVNAPGNGIVIPTLFLKEKLTELTTRLGLSSFEQQEFLDYWLPHLYDLHSPYILFSVLNSQEKERVDHVDISPKPDTMIEFIAYFKPLKERVDIKPLVLPDQPPARVGFTAVEWGGTIDTK